MCLYCYVHLEQSQNHPFSYKINIQFQKRVSRKMSWKNIVSERCLIGRFEKQKQAFPIIRVANYKSSWSCEICRKLMPNGFKNENDLKIKLWAPRGPIFEVFEVLPEVRFLMIFR